MRILLTFFFGLILVNGLAQDAASENNLALNYKVESWKFNTSFGHRAVREKINESTGNRLAFLEINQFVTRKVNSRLSVSLGYKYRDLNSAEGEVEHRLTQQAAYTHRTEHVRLVSRLRIEQRFRDEFAHRYRYRFSLDVPLSGLKLDVNEFYLVVSNELIYQQSRQSENIDNRFSAGSGYVFSQSIKLQLDLTHRMEELNSDVEHIPFLTTSLIINVN